MGIVRALLWTFACVAAGIALATVDVKGQTPWEHLRGATRSAPALDAVKGDVVNAVEVAKRKLSSKPAAPTEKHTESERDAVNQLVAGRARR